MKSKIMAVGLGVVLLGGAYVYLQQWQAESVPTTDVVPVVKTSPNRELAPITSATPLVSAPETKPAQGGALTGAEIEAKINRLKNLQTEDDDASLAEILAELRNPNRQIRHEAIEATCQFQRRSAIPVLEALAAETADPAEKKELLDAAEFLKLPTYTEYLAEQKKAKEAAKAAVPAQ